MSSQVTDQCRPTSIGWDSDDDASLKGYILKKSPPPRYRSPGHGSHQRRHSVSKSRSRSRSRDSFHRPMRSRSRSPSLRQDRNYRVSPSYRPRVAIFPPNDGNPFSGLSFSNDATLERMQERKKALLRGRFKILSREDSRFLEDTPDFLDAIEHAFPSRRIHYVAVPRGYRQSNYPKTKYTAVRFDYPGQGDRSHVLWTTTGGDINIDRMVKLYNIHDIQGHEIEGLSESPKSPWFGLIDPRKTSTHDSKINFDANMFWTVGLLFKHFGTCGVEQWDREIDNLSKTQSLIERQISSQPLPTNSAPPAPFLSLPPPPLLNCLEIQPLTTTPALARPNLIQALPAVKQALPEPEPLESYAAAPPSTLITLVNNTNHLDFELGKRYTGCVTAWRQTYGFLSCTLIPGKIFLHSQNMTGSSSSDLPIGSSVNFELSSDESTGRFRAIRAKAYM